MREVNHILKANVMFKSIRDLESNRRYEIVEAAVVETANCRRIRLTLIFRKSGELAYVYLPERLVPYFEMRVKKLNEKIKLETWYLIYIGERGRSFDLKLTTKKED